MSIHKLFAANLREECLRFVSIAEVCRGADINRQQFNKYLSGQALPNPRTLARLCKFLGVEEPVLFELRKDAVRLGGLKFSISHPKRAELGEEGKHPDDARHVIDKLVALSSMHRTTIKPGYYFCYMPFNKVGSFVVRAVVKVAATERANTFCRRTSFRNVSTPKANLTVGKHSGVIMTDSISSFFVGRNKIYPHEVTVLKVPKSPPIKGTYSVGQALIYSAAEDTVLDFWFEWLGETLSVGKSALKQLGVVPIDHMSLSMDMRNLLSGHFREGTVRLSEGISRANHTPAFTEAIPTNAP